MPVKVKGSVGSEAGSNGASKSRSRRERVPDLSPKASTVVLGANGAMPQAPGSPIPPEVAEALVPAGGPERAGRKKKEQAPPPEAPPAKKRIRKPKPEAPPEAPEPDTGDPAPEPVDRPAPPSDAPPATTQALDVPPDLVPWVGLADGADVEVEIEAISAEDMEWHNQQVALAKQGRHDFGLHLANLKARRTYRFKFRSFGEFVREEFGVSGRGADYQIGAAQAIEQLKALGVDEADLPGSTSAARELTRVPEEDREAVLRAANEAARAAGRSRATRDDVIGAAQATGKTREPRRVANARERGTVGPGPVQVDQVEDAGPGDPGDAKAEADLTRAVGDYDYLNGFSLRARLADDPKSLFDAEALFYRDFEAPRKALIEGVTGPGIARIKDKLGQIGPYSARIQRALRTPDPSYWVICETCQGTGIADVMGEKKGCLDCYRNGFKIPG